jgi:cardiolipin synthase A/B
MTGPVAPPTGDVQALVDRAMDRVAGGRAIPGNKVVILFDGPEVFPAMLDRITAARRWIHFDNYIFHDDTTGRLFADALSQQATAGIKVRVMADWLGSWGTSRKFWRRLRA